MAPISPHGRLTVKLDGPPQQRLQRGPGHAHRGSKRGRLHPEPSGEPVEHRAHLQLDARAGAALHLPLPARHGLQLRGVHVRAADQDTATASSIAAALLSYYTIAQVDGLLAGKLGVTEAASALQIAVRFPDDGGAMAFCCSPFKGNSTIIELPLWRPFLGILVAAHWSISALPSARDIGLEASLCLPFRRRPSVRTRPTRNVRLSGAVLLINCANFVEKGGVAGQPYLVWLGDQLLPRHHSDQSAAGEQTGTPKNTRAAHRPAHLGHQHCAASEILASAAVL